MSKKVVKRFIDAGEAELKIDPGQFELDEKAEIKTRAARKKTGGKSPKKPIALKLEEYLLEYVDKVAEEDYVSRTAYIRQLIIKDMKEREQHGTTGQNN